MKKILYVKWRHMMDWVGLALKWWCTDEWSVWFWDDALKVRSYFVWLMYIHNKFTNWDLPLMTSCQAFYYNATFRLFPRSQHPYIFSQWVMTVTNNSWQLYSYLVQVTNTTSQTKSIRKEMIAVLKGKGIHAGNQWVTINGWHCSAETNNESEDEIVLHDERPGDR